VLTNETRDGTHTFVFQDGDGPPLTLTFSEGQLTDAMSDARAELLKAHIDFSGPRPRDRLHPHNRKGRDELITDLGRLAELGFRYWTALFQQTGSDLACARPLAGGTVQIARVPSSAFVFPWAAVYQRPPGTPPYDLCPLLAEWGGDSPLFEGAPPRCPFEEQHGRAQLLCPFDFWGYRFAIEHPPSIRDRRLDRVVHVVDPPEMAIAASSVLDAAESRRHFDALRDGLAGFAVGPAAETVFEVGRSLSASDLAIVYFYCHGGGVVGGDPWLEVAEGERISPTTITAWYLSDWPEHHWDSTHPIVLLNGCHTAELLPQSPVNFVDVFTAVNASGVVGTEITLHQRMAGEAAEVLLGHLGGANPLPVGEGLRRTRLQFLCKGNILGLAYTAYCAAELRLVRDAAA
jgi:hypothetical protein